MKWLICFSMLVFACSDEAGNVLDVVRDVGVVDVSSRDVSLRDASLSDVARTDVARTDVTLDKAALFDVAAPSDAVVFDSVVDAPVDAVVADAPLSDATSFDAAILFDSGVDVGPSDSFVKLDTVQTCTTHDDCDDNIPCTVDGCGIVTPGVCVHLLEDKNICLIDGLCHLNGEVVPDSCGKCDVATSQTSWTPIADFTPCNDKNECSYSDKCFSGVCQGTPFTCPPPKLSCEVVTCSPGSGQPVCAPGIEPYFCVHEGKCVADGDWVGCLYCVGDHVQSTYGGKMTPSSLCSDGGGQ